MSQTPLEVKDEWSVKYKESTKGYTCRFCLLSVVAHIKSLADPVAGNAAGIRRETVDVLGGGAAVLIDVAC